MFACSSYGTKECLLNMMMKVGIFNTWGQLTFWTIWYVEIIMRQLWCVRRDAGGVTLYGVERLQFFVGQWRINCLNPWWFGDVIYLLCWDECCLIMNGVDEQAAWIYVLCDWTMVWVVMLGRVWTSDLPEFTCSMNEQWMSFNDRTSDTCWKMV